jgi:hypothetical protein
MLIQLKTVFLREGIDNTQLPLTMDSAYASQALRAGKATSAGILSTSLLQAKATMSLRLTVRNGMRRHGRKS